MRIKFVIALALMIAIGIQICGAQGLLGRTISLDVRNQRLDNVLEILSNKGDFYFSYSSNLVKKDSLVTVTAVNRPVKEILAQLFSENFEFRESGNYIIIRRAPIKLMLVTNKGVIEERIYFVSGHVYDENSGNGINDASVYEKRLLASTLTNNEGYFKLRLKSNKASTAQLTVSKEFYEDTTVQIQPRRSQELFITLIPFQSGSTVTVSPEDYLVPDTLKKVEVTRDSLNRVLTSTDHDSAVVERTGLGRFLLSGKQRIQTINLKKFFTSRPFQVSLTPGLSSHGKMSSQVINNFSLNVFGGYTAGTNGVEIGGLFNIDKKAVRYFQVGGLFNAVGGSVNGFQAGGLNNTVLDSVNGFQVAGLNNIVSGKFKGWQVAGIYNHVSDSFKGVQVGGVANFTKKKLTGVQIAGVVNFSNREMTGVQISGVINYAKRMKGVQIGLINISDSSDGFGIGLINIVLKGYHKLTVSANELLNVNVAFKTGSRRLYNILQAGMNTGEVNKVYSFGYGIGTELNINRKRTLTMNPELISNYLYLGSWDYTNIQNKLQLNFNLKLGKYISLFAGPTYNVMVSDQKQKIEGYRFPIPPHGYNTTKFSDKVFGWLGWNAGINIF